MYPLYVIRVDARKSGRYNGRMKTRKRIVVGVVGLFLVFSAVWLTTIRRAPNLFAHATYISDNSHWLANRWIDRSSLFIVEGQSGQVSGVYVLNTVSGARRELPRSAVSLSRIGNELNIRPSPNGKFVLVSDWQKMPGKHLVLDAVDGRVVQRVQAHGVLCWLLDSSGLICWRKTRPPNQFVVRLDGSTYNYPPAPAVPGRDFLLTDKETMIAGVYDPYGRTPLVLKEVDLKAGKSIRSLPVPLPPACLPSEVEISSDSEYIAWTVRPHPLPMWLSWLPETITQSDDRNYVWVSRLDGSNMKLVGGCPVEYGTDYDTNLGVEWIPGSDDLAVTLGHKLFRVPTGAAR